MINKYFKLPRKNIAPVQFIIEGYGEMATVTTLNAREAIIQISIMSDFISDMTGVIESLKNKYNMEELTGPDK
jgi:hypothetical protein